MTVKLYQVLTIYHRLNLHAFVDSLLKLCKEMQRREVISEVDFPQGLTVNGKTIIQARRV